MAMVVQCNCCMTEYRLNEALLKGAKGACIRCPKCRERIFVENPGAAQVAPPIPHGVPPPTAPPIGHMVPPPIAPPVPPLVVPPLAPRARPRFTPPRMSSVASQVASPNSPPKVPLTLWSPAVDVGSPTVRVASTGGMTSPVPRDRRAEGSDLSGRIRPDPVPGFDDGIVVSPTPAAATDPSDTPLRVEEYFTPPPAVEEKRRSDGGDDGPMAIRSRGPGRNPPPGRPRYRRPLFLAAAISSLLLAGGAYYYVDGNTGRKPSGNVIPAHARNAPGNAIFDVGNLKGYLNNKASGEPFYVVKGTVTNIGKVLDGGIRIEATLLGKDNQAIVKNGTFAGNVIDESLISHMTRVRVEAFLGMRYGEGNVNRIIPEGKTLPFMVVFFDLPREVESFRVKAIDADEADRVNPPDGGIPGTRASNLQPIRLN